jgi:hypothetical protein
VVFGGAEPHASVVSAVSGGSAPPSATTTGAAVPRRTLVDLVVVSGIVAAVLVAPLVGWVEVHRIAETAQLSSSAAADAGARDAGLDPRVFHRLRGIIPPHATYWADASPLIRPDTTRGALSLWAWGSLEPRVAVARADEADWVVTWGYRPERLPVSVSDVRALSVTTPPKLPVYVARVVR